MSRRAFAIIIAGFLTIFSHYAVRYSYGLLLPAMLPSLGISMAQAGIIYSSFFIAYTIFSPVLGLLIDRFNARMILTFFILLFGAGTFLISFASTVWNAVIFFILAGIGGSACWVPVTTLIQRWVNDKRRGTVLAIADIGSAVGVAVVSLAMPFLVTTCNWQSGWKYLGIMAMLTAVANYFLVRNRPAGDSNKEAIRSKEVSRGTVMSLYGKFLRDRNFWLIGMSYLLLGFLVLVPFTYLSTYAMREFLLPYATAARLIMIIALTGIAGKLILGPVSDAIGRIKVLILCLVLIASGSFGMVYSRSYSLLIAATVICGLGYGPVWALYAASASDYFSKESTGSILGLWTVMLGIGSILSPIITGYTIDITQSFRWAFLEAAICAILSVVMLMPLFRTAHRSNAVN
jgi:sugar phosphate permease